MSRGSRTVRPRSTTPARMTTRSRGTIDSGSPVKSQQHVDRELRTVEIGLDDGVGHVVEEELELAAVAHRERADAAAADARLDEQRKLRVGRQVGRQVRLAPRRSPRSASTRQVVYLSLQIASSRAATRRPGSPASAKRAVLLGEQRQLVVDRRHDQADALGAADVRDGVEIAGIGRERHRIRAIGDVDRRRQRIDVGDDHRAAAASCAARAETPGRAARAAIRR